MTTLLLTSEDGDSITARADAITVVEGTGSGSAIVCDGAWVYVREPADLIIAALGWDAPVAVETRPVPGTEAGA